MNLDMLTYTPSLFAGPYDWLPERIPLEEFERRIEAVRSVLRAHGAAGVIVHGRSVDYAALAYLTGFVPKLNAAFAFMGMKGPIRILFSGGTAMAESAKRLTFVEDVCTLTDLKANVATWLAEHNIENRNIALWDGSALSKDHHNFLVDGLGANRLIELNDSLDLLRRSKSVVEHSTIMKAANIVGECFAVAEEAIRNGSNTHQISMTTERAGYLLGAQDIRIRVSTNDQGFPNLVSDVPLDKKQDSPNLYVAARVSGYWAQAAMTLGMQTPLRQHARDVLDGYIDVLGKDRATSPQKFMYGLKNRNSFSIKMNGIGLNLREAPFFADTLVATPATAALADGDICSIIVEMRDGAQAGFASALIAVTKDRVHSMNLRA